MNCRKHSGESFLWRINELYKSATFNQKRKRYNSLSENIQMMVRNTFPWLVLAGGSLRTVFDDKDQINDYDLFILGNEGEVIDKKIELVNYLKNEYQYKVIFDCPKGELKTFKCGNIKVQIITLENTFYSDVFELLDSFDINASRIALQENDLYFSKKAIGDIKNKKVTLHKLTYPSATLNRMFKYKQKGYNIYNTFKEYNQKFIENVQNGVEMKLDIIYVD